jgi:hypothetical protein
MRPIVITLALLVLLAGCGATPSRVSLPSHLYEGNVDANGRPAAAGDAQKQYDKVAREIGIQPVATSRKAVLYQVNLLIGDWNSQASLLLGERDIADNATFVGMLVGSALVLSNEIKAAKQVAGTVAGIKLFEDNYKTVIQAANYAAAAEAVECVRTQVLDVSEGVWTKFFDANGNVQGTEDPVQQAALQQTFPQINAALSSIYKKLRANQRAVRVSAPTADSISKVIADTQAQAGIVNTTANRSVNSVNGVRTFLIENGANSELDVLLLKQLLGVGGKAQACATAMGA